MNVWRRVPLGLSYSLLILLLLGIAPYSAAQATPAEPSALPDVRTLSALGPTEGSIYGTAIAGNFVIYRADYDIEGRTELYSVALAGGSPIRLNESLPAGAVTQFAVAGTSVVFSIRDESSGQYFLYSVPASGGTPHQLNLAYPSASGGMEPGTTDFTFAISPDNTRVVFAHDQSTKSVVELFSAPINGSAVRISTELPTWAIAFPVSVPAFWISPDSQSVAYLLDLSASGSSANLYCVPIGGGSSVKLNSTTYLPSSTTDAQFTPDSTRFIYVASLATSQDERLISVLLDGTGTVELATDNYITFQISEADGRVVFTSFNATSNTTALKSVPIASGVTTVLAAAINTSSSNYVYVVLDPSGETAFFTSAGAIGFSRVPVAGGTVTPVFTTANVNLYSMHFSADGQRLFFLAGDYGANGLYSYLLSSGTATRIDDQTVTGGGIWQLFVPASGDRIIYSARTNTNAAPALYSVPMAGGTSLKLSGTPVGDENIIYAWATHNGEAIFSTGTDNGSSRYPYHRLFHAPIDGSSAATLLDSSRAIVGDVTDFDVSPTDGRAVYRADQETDGVFELYSVPVAGGTPVRLNSAGAQVQGFVISPVGKRVIYAAVASGASTVSLYSVPIIGGTSAVIGDTLSYGQSFYGYAFTPDGAYAFYMVGTSSAATDNILYRAPATGGAATVVAEQVSTFQIDPTGTRVVYVAGTYANQLNSIPVSGGTAVTLGTANRSDAILISPDGKWVVSNALQAFGSSGLQSIPIGGGSIASLTSNAELQSLNAQISADSAFVIVSGTVVSSNSNDPIVQRIQQIPIAGGTAVTLTEITSPAANTAPTLTFAQASGGGPVVYRLSRAVDLNTVEHTLASVPLAGGDKTVLYGPTSLGSTSFNFTLSDDGALVLLQAGTDLYRVATSGGTVLKLNPVDDASPIGFSAAGKIVFVAGGDLYMAQNDGSVVTKLAIGHKANQSINEIRFIGEAVIFRSARDIDAAQDDPGVKELLVADLADTSFQVFLPTMYR